MTGAIRVYVPGDAATLSVGGAAVAEAFTKEAARRGLDFALVRNGSRGLFWLEPLVEIATATGRCAFGPVTAGDVAELFDAGLPIPRVATPRAIRLLWVQWMRFPT